MKTKYYHKNSEVVAYRKNINSEGYITEKTYDKKGNQLTYKDSDGFSWESTYDENGNELTYKNSIGFSWERTYDKMGKELTYKDSIGFSWERTYDKKGNELTYKDSNGVYTIKGITVTKEEFENFINNQNRPCVGKKIIVDGVEYELK